MILLLISKIQFAFFRLENDLREIETSSNYFASFLSWNVFRRNFLLGVHVCQQSEGQAVFYERKQCKIKTQVICSVKTHAEVESILRGSAEHGQVFGLERWGEVSWVYLVFFVFSFCSPLAAEIVNQIKKGILFGSCLADSIVAVIFHIIVPCYISVKPFFLLNELLRFRLVYW